MRKIKFEGDKVFFGDQHVLDWNPCVVPAMCEAYGRQSVYVDITNRLVSAIDIKFQLDPIELFDVISDCHSYLSRIHG